MCYSGLNIHLFFYLASIIIKMHSLKEASHQQRSVSVCEAERRPVLAHFFLCPPVFSVYEHVLTAKNSGDYYTEGYDLTTYTRVY